MERVPEAPHARLILPGAVRRRIGQALGARAFGTPRISDTPIAPHVTR